MRELTEDELKLAPDWATHYFIYNDGDILFEGNRNYQYYNSRIKEFYKLRWLTDISEYTVPINRKPFDITKHEWSDSGIERLEVGGGVLTIYSPEHTVNLTFDDAIAIANHFGLTAEDLK